MDKPVWPYLLVTVCGLALFAGSIFFLVATVRATGLGQYYWAFNFVVVLFALSALISIFVTKHD